MATYTGIKKIKIGNNVFEFAVDWSNVTNQPTIPVNTDSKLEIANLNSNTWYNLLVGSDTTTASTRQYDSWSGLRFYRQTAIDSGPNYGILRIGNNIASSTSNNERGAIQLFGKGTGYSRITTLATAQRNIDFPDAAGTIALTSDVPKIQIVRW